MICTNVLQHLTALSEAVDLPVNADFESGFASDPQGVAANVALAVRAGVAGLSIEDRIVGDLGRLYETPLAVERIRAARAAIDKSGEDVILVARTESLLIGGTAAAAIDKLVSFANAGADCLYAPGVRSRDDIAAMVRAVTPKPLNVLVLGPDLSFGELSDLGVRRISVGSGLARIAWGAAIDAAKRLKTGSFEGLADGMPSAQLNEIFRGFV